MQQNSISFGCIVLYKYCRSDDGACPLCWNLLYRSAFDIILKVLCTMCTWVKSCQGIEKVSHHGLIFA